MTVGHIDSHFFVNRTFKKEMCFGNLGSFQVRLGRKDSNLRITGSKPVALPLGHAPSTSQ